MLAVLIFVALAGAFLGLRFKVFVLGPVIPIVGLAIIAKGVATDQASHAILLTLLAAILCLQVSYFISGIVGAYVGTTDRRPKPFRAVRTAIGEELKTFYAVTEELPPRDDRAAEANELKGTLSLLAEIFLRNTATYDRGPVWVIFDRDEAAGRPRHVGCGPESGSKIRILSPAAMALAVRGISRRMISSSQTGASKSCATNSTITNGVLSSRCCRTNRAVFRV